MKVNVTQFIRKIIALGLQKQKRVAEIEEEEATERGKRIETNISTVKFQESIELTSAHSFAGFTPW